MNLKFAFLYLSFGLHVCLQQPAGGEISNEEFKRFCEMGSNLGYDYNLKEPFKGEELRTLADKPTRSDEEQRRLMQLILHAAIKQDGAFQDLLKKNQLRDAKNVDLALSAYDYMLNKSEMALDHILADLASEEMGADTVAITVLAVIDEWNRTIRAFHKHFYRTDGAGAESYGAFKMRRAHLYPIKYLEMREAIEARIVWPAPLLPAK
jgi:hypothetical protein